MSTKVLILKLTATLAALLCGGCNMPPGNGTQTPPPAPQNVVVEPQKPAEPQTINLKITVDGEGKVSVGGKAEVNVHTVAASPTDKPDGRANESRLPEVIVYWNPIEQTSREAKRELDESTNLPFRVRWKTAAPKWVTEFPAFHWSISNTDWRSCDNWNGVESFVALWKNSFPQSKANAAQTKVSAARNSFQKAPPDRSQVGARSVAHWSINGDFTPSRSVLLSHLMHDGIHRGQHDKSMLESLTTEQLRGLHDRDHGN